MPKDEAKEATAVPQGRLERRGAILARLRRRFVHVPADISLADELLARRREEAKREHDA